MRKLLFGMTILSLGIGALYASSKPLREIPGLRAYSQSPQSQRQAKPAREIPGAKAQKENSIHCNKSSNANYICRQIPGTNAAISEIKIAPNTIGIAPAPVMPKKAVHQNILQNTSNTVIINNITAAQAPVTPQRIIPGSKTIISNNIAAQSNTFPKVYQVRTCAHLTPIAMFEKEKVMQLSDGSLWRFRHRHRHIAKNWKKGDVITIEVKAGSSRNRYQLINHSRGEVIKIKFPIESENFCL